MNMLKYCCAFALLVSACGSSGDTGGPTDNPSTSSGGKGGSKSSGGSGGGAKGGSGGTSIEPGGSGGAPAGGSSGDGSGGAPVAGAGGSANPGSGGSDPGSPDAAGAGGSAMGGATGMGGSTPPPPGAGTPVLTGRYDNLRTGSTTAETVLTTTNVTAAKFGLVGTRAYKGVVYGQPLYVPGLMIGGAKKNVVYVATEENMVYAFDADGANGAPLWSKMLDEAPWGFGGAYTPSCADMKAAGKAGITSTPVIDLDQNRIYVMAKGDGGHHLHALDLTTGAESTAAAAVSAPGFNSDRHINRPGLLELNGIIYAGFGSHCDDNPYHGWIFAFDAKTLAAKGSYNVTPDENGGAVWQSGMGLYGDDNGVVFCSGNTKGGSMFGGNNLAQSVVRVKQSGNAVMATAHFTPDDAAGLNSADNDLTAGVTGVPGTGLILSGGKQGPIYVLDGGLALKATVRPPAAKDRDGLHSIAAWAGSAGPMVYSWPSGGRLYAYGVANGALSLKSTGGTMLSHPGGVVTISSNGTMPGTGVVWANVPGTGDSWHGTAVGQIIAFDATDVSKQLWSSDDDDAAPPFTYAKFSPPLVANGRVYLATFSGKLNIYGLK
jgi:hypothetical protein